MKVWLLTGVVALVLAVPAAASPAGPSACASETGCEVTLDPRHRQQEFDDPAGRRYTVMPFQVIVGGVGLDVAWSRGCAYGFRAGSLHVAVRWCVDEGVVVRYRGGPLAASFAFHYWLMRY